MERITKLLPAGNNAQNDNIISDSISDVLSFQKDAGTIDSGNLSMSYADEFAESQTLNNATMSKFSRQ